MALYSWSCSPWWDDRLRCIPRRDVLNEIDRMVRHVEDLSRSVFAPLVHDEPQTVATECGGVSSVINDDKKFQISLDVKHFKPEELELTTRDNQLVVHGKHEEQKDEHGFVKREFTRAYWLPQGINPESFKSNLSSEGVLTIEAPKLAPVEPGEYKIPIEVAKK
uniref:SHSP domain-containing protein n=1 Tax=Trichuris muris TaxID=70415 RepID=A0A5S6Q039_TRIMR